MLIVEQSKALTHVALSGRLDTAGVDQVEAKFNAAVVAPRRNAIVDMSSVDFLSSMGLRMLLIAAKILDRSGAKMVMLAPRPLICETIRQTGVDIIIPVAHDLDSAHAYFRPERA